MACNALAPPHCFRPDIFITSPCPALSVGKTLDITTTAPGKRVVWCGALDYGKYYLGSRLTQLLTFTQLLPREHGSFDLPHNHLSFWQHAPQNPQYPPLCSTLLHKPLLVSATLISFPGLVTKPNSDQELAFLPETYFCTWKRTSTPVTLTNLPIPRPTLVQPHCHEFLHSFSHDAWSTPDPCFHSCRPPTSWASYIQWWVSHFSPSPPSSWRSLLFSAILTRILLFCHKL